MKVQKWQIDLRSGMYCTFIVLLSQLCSAQIIAIQAGDYYAFMRNETRLTPYEFTEVPAHLDEVFWVNKGDLYGFLDTNLNVIADYVYTDVSSFENGFARVSRDSLYGYIDKNGIEICPLKFEEVLPYSNGVACVRDSLHWGLLNSIGEVEVDLEYDHPPKAVGATFFLVSKNGKWGVVGKGGVILYALEYDLITPDGVAYIGEKKEYLGLL